MHYIDSFSLILPHMHSCTHTDMHHTTIHTSETMQYNTRHRHCPHGKICLASVRTRLKDKTSNTHRMRPTALVMENQQKASYLAPQRCHMTATKTGIACIIYLVCK